MSNKTLQNNENVQVVGNTVISAFGKLRQGEFLSLKPVWLSSKVQLHRKSLPQKGKNQGLRMELRGRLLVQNVSGSGLRLPTCSEKLPTNSENLNASEHPTATSKKKGRILKIQ